MPRPTFLAPLLLTALLLACGGDDDADTSASNGAASPIVSDEATPQPTAAADKPTQEAAPVGVTDEPVRFETSDGVTIAGHLYSAAGPKRQVVVLAHELPKDQTAWTEFANKLAAVGIDALTFDFRSYGETGGPGDISKIDLDLEAAARFIASRDYAQVYLFGASMGGTAAIKVASRLDLAGLVTISSPHMIMGLDASQDIAAVTEPKLFIAGSFDANGAYVAIIESFMGLTPDPKDRIIYEESAHGTELFGTPSGPDLEEALFTFLETH
ncbi:MAG TPA: alpha/beta fold hydrolase [Dehalococcoidia bacterium]|nr:alpha/beta fold hydrolase [Dehalococcoidia bacterium]